MAFPFRAPRGLLVALFSMAAIGGAMDYAIAGFQLANLQRDAIFALVAVLLATDREGPLAGRLKLWAGLVAGGFVAMLAVHDIADHGHRRQAIYAVFSQPGVYFWFVTLWQATALLSRRRADGSVRDAWFRRGIGALLAYDTLCLASAAASVSHDISLHSYYMERALMFAPLLGWMRAAESDGELRHETAKVLVSWLGAMILIGGIVAVLSFAGGDALRARLVDLQFVYLRGLDAGPGFPERRLQFPMLHFNRTAYYGMLSLFALLAAASARHAAPGRGLRSFLYATACVAFAVILLSYTRGIILATTAGLFVWALLSSRRMAAGLAAGCVLLVVLMTAEQHKFLMTAFDPKTYNVGHGELTSMKARIVAFEFGLKRIAEHPLTGMGYGDKIVRQDFLDFENGPAGDPRIREMLRQGNPMVHLHDVWIETAVESGLPALAAFLAFMFIRWGMLMRRWRESASGDRMFWAVWMALEAALAIAGMIFYMLKQNSGMLTWEIWAFVFVAASGEGKSSVAESQGGS